MRVVLEILRWMSIMGLQPLRTAGALRNLPWFFRQLKQFRAADPYPDFPITNLLPCLFDRNDQSGALEPHYFHQDLLVAQKIFTNNPKRHIDVGSRIDGFVAHVASFRTIEMIDIRPQSALATNISFIQADLMEVDPNMEQCTDSLSCLHAIEHFGLGRYGDPLQPDGHLIAFSNLHKMLRPSGKLYFSTPAGHQRIEFNAHRVFSLEYLCQMFQNRFQVDSFSLVDDTGQLQENLDWTPETREGFSSLSYGCAIFELTKI